MKLPYHGMGFPYCGNVKKFLKSNPVLSWVLEALTRYSMEVDVRITSVRRTRPLK